MENYAKYKLIDFWNNYYLLQSVIIAKHDDCAYSKMGVGIWNGLLLIMTGISLLVIVTRKKGKT